MKLFHDEIEVEVEVEVVVHSDLQILVVVEVSTGYFLDCPKRDLDDSSNLGCKCYYKLSFKVL